MKKNPEKEALDHALQALGDGDGHCVWGPGVVGEKLWKNGHDKAATAFDLAALNAVQLQLTGRERMTAFIRKTAPVILEAIDDER